MNIDRSLRPADRRVVAWLVLTLAGLGGALGVVVDDPSVDATRADLAVPRPSLAIATPARSRAAPTIDTTTSRPVETWAADEASSGTRPDTAH